MRIVLVGGSGYLGTEVARRLQAKGHSLVNVSRNGKAAAGAPGVRYTQLLEMCQGADVVVNLAGANLGAKRWSPERREEIVNSRVDVTRQVVQAIAACDRKPALVSMSAVGYYGNTMIPSGEALGHGSTFLGELCNVWEHEAMQAAAVTRVVILQHPREKDMPIGTARMAALCLPQARLHVGVDWDGRHVLRDATSAPARPAILLWPGPGARDILTEPPAGPVTLIVVD
ncbi:MAG: NAD-dependent epimerase/dehydratase family protein, partial [Ignavibacteriae bacterium]